VWQALRGIKRATSKSVRRCGEFAGYNIARCQDYYSPLPTETQIERNELRWNKPSKLNGIDFDLDELRRNLKDLVEPYWAEFAALPPYRESRMVGFGPGYTELDAMLLYMMIRDLKPRRYLEVGGGISTYYCSLAAQENLKQGCKLEILCVEPYPLKKLYSIPGIHVVKDEVQNVKLEEFEKLEAGDVLFIDSSHVVRIDGDVPYLFLEVLPTLKPGVVIHVHDISFPFNIPYPPEFWVLGTLPAAPYWPTYWNEAMLLQAFLAFNREFKIIQSTPLLRFHDEPFLRQLIPTYRGVDEEPNTYSAIWLRRVGAGDQDSEKC
jgi:predicted O-methyltransferase YrrM